VLGGACPSVLSPSTAAVSDGDSVDLIVFAPTRDERQDRTWVNSAAAAAALRLSPDGIVYLVPAQARRLHESLVAAGLQVAETLLHLPDLPASRHVVPVGTAAERYVLSGRLGMAGAKRLAASLALRSSWLSAFGPTGTVLCPDPTTPLAAWLFALDQAPARAGSVLLTSRRATSGGNVLHRFVEGRQEPDAVAKVSRRAGDERLRLMDIAPGAARAGARVPQVLWSGELGPAEALVQSALPGVSAAGLLERGRLDPRDLVTRVSRLLERWNRAEARPRTLADADLDRFVLAPATRLAADRPRYLDYLRRLCARAAGSRCSFVPCHGDLTATNVLVDRDDHLGILDWEEGSAEGLPLTDFFYAAADAVAAIDGYAGRPQAARACFSLDGDRAPFVRQLTQDLAAALDLEAAVQEVCFHACWLHHAWNEEHRGSDPAERPFRAIVTAVANDPVSFSTALFGRR
jgi:aminoglycoside phosphotransferase